MTNENKNNSLSYLLNWYVPTHDGGLVERLLKLVKLKTKNKHLERAQKTDMSQDNYRATYDKYRLYVYSYQICIFGDM